MSVEFERKVITTVTAEITLNGDYVATQLISEVTGQPEVVTSIDAGVVDEAIAGEFEKIGDEKILQYTMCIGGSLLAVTGNAVLRPEVQRALEKPSLGNIAVASAGIVILGASGGIFGFVWRKSLHKIQAINDRIEVLEQAKDVPVTSNVSPVLD